MEQMSIKTFYVPLSCLSPLQKDIIVMFQNNIEFKSIFYGILEVSPIYHWKSHIVLEHYIN